MTTTETTPATPITYRVTKRFTGGTLEGLEHTEDTRVRRDVGERVDQPCGGSPYVVVACDPIGPREHPGDGASAEDLRAYSRSIAREIAGVAEGDAEGVDRVQYRAAEVGCLRSIIDALAAERDRRYTTEEVVRALEAAGMDPLAVLRALRDHGKK